MHRKELQSCELNPWKAMPSAGRRWCGLSPKAASWDGVRLPVGPTPRRSMPSSRNLLPTSSDRIRDGSNTTGTTSTAWDRSADPSCPGRSVPSTSPCGTSRASISASQSGNCLAGSHATRCACISSWVVTRQNPRPRTPVPRSMTALPPSSSTRFRMASVT